MLIQNKKIRNNGLFFTELDGEKLAEMVYTMPSQDKLITEHTEIDEKLKGKNAGVNYCKWLLSMQERIT